MPTEDIIQSIKNLIPRQSDLVIALTWSPRPVNGTPREQFNHFRPTLMKLKLCCENYVIYAELNVNGSIHFHGELVIKDRIKWFKHVLPLIKNLGYVMIKKNPDLQWTKYISKDAEMMKELLDFDLPITDDHPLMMGIRKNQRYYGEIGLISKSMDITSFRYESDSEDQSSTNTEALGRDAPEEPD